MEAQAGRIEGSKDRRMAAAVLALVALALAALAHASRLPLAVFSHGPRAQHRDLLQLTDEELALDQYAHLADKLNDPEALAGLRVLYQVGVSSNLPPKPTAPTNRVGKQELACVGSAPDHLHLDSSRSCQNTHQNVTQDPFRSGAQVLR